MTIHSFFECLLCVTYINSVTHRAFYLIDNTFRLTFTFVDKFSVDFGWKRKIKFSIHEVFGKYSPPVSIYTIYYILYTIYYIVVFNIAVNTWLYFVESLFFYYIDHHSPQKCSICLHDLPTTVACTTKTAEGNFWLQTTNGLWVDLPTDLHTRATNNLMWEKFERNSIQIH